MLRVPTIPHLPGVTQDRARTYVAAGFFATCVAAQVLVGVQGGGTATAASSPQGGHPAQAAAARPAVAQQTGAQVHQAVQQRQQQPAADRGGHRAPVAAAPSGTPRQIARQLIGDDAQFQCFARIVSHESDWQVTATNPSSGSYGLVQALPAEKMASQGADWRTNPVTQIKWGLHYMNSRYGSPCAAWSFWQVHSWY